MKRNRQFDELLAKVPEETKRRVCKWLRSGDECGKGLPGTPCEVVGCVAWEHYEPADAMKMLDEKIKKATKTWEGVDADRYLAEVRGVDVELRDAAKSLVQTVEGYVCPKKGDKYVFRNEVLAKCNKLKKILDERK